MLKIQHFKPNSKGGALKASFQVIFNINPWGPWCLNMTFFQKDNGQSWFGYPQKEYVNADGQKKYFKLAYPSEEAKESFEAELRKALMSQVPAMQNAFCEQLPTQAFSPSFPENEEIPF